MSEYGFTEQISKQLLSHQWLVKIDNTSSNSYLFKFHCSPENQCCILVTDTINVWYEVLDPRYLTRRWRALNKGSLPPSLELDEELRWRTKIAQHLSKTHTSLAIQEVTFSIEESYEADLAIDLEDLNSGKWRWECYKLGYKASAQLLSKHLFLPLVSVANLAFASADPVSELTTSDLEEAVDNIAKAGRRAQTIFIRQTFSRPRTATTMARVSAMLNFITPVPSIQDDYITDVHREAPEDLGTTSTSSTEAAKVAKTETLSQRSSPYPDPSPQQRNQELAIPPASNGKSQLSLSLSNAFETKKRDDVESDGSTTEPDNENDDAGRLLSKDVKEKFNTTETLSRDGGRKEDELSSPPAAKRSKRSPSADTSERQNRSGGVSNSSNGPALRKVGIRQPVKRGGKRF